MTQKFAQPAEAEFKGSIPIIYKEKKLVKTLSTCLTLTKEWWNGYHIKKMMDARADFKSYSNYLLACILIIIFVSIHFQLNNWMENNKTEDNFSWPATSSPMLTLVTADPTGDETNN